MDVVQLVEPIVARTLIDRNPRSSRGTSAIGSANSAGSVTKYQSSRRDCQRQTSEVKRMLSTGLVVQLDPAVIDHGERAGGNAVEVRELARRGEKPLLARAGESEHVVVALLVSVVKLENAVGLKRGNRVLELVDPREAVLVLPQARRRVESWFWGWGWGWLRF